MEDQDPGAKVAGQVAEKTKAVKSVSAGATTSSSSSSSESSVASPSPPPAEEVEVAAPPKEQGDKATMEMLAALEKMKEP